MRIILLSLTILACWAAELPQDVQAAIDKAESAKAKIDQALIKDLTKLQETYTKKGNLDAANGIKAKIDATTASLPDLMAATPEKKTGPWIIGKWKIQSDKHNNTVILITKDGKASWGGSLAGAWKETKTGVLVTWNNGIIYDIGNDKQYTEIGQANNTLSTGMIIKWE